MGSVNLAIPGSRQQKRGGLLHPFCFGQLLDWLNLCLNEADCSKISNHCLQIFHMLIESKGQTKTTLHLCVVFEYAIR